MKRLSGALIVIMLALATAPAVAHPLLDQAQRAIDDIDPEAARTLARQAIDSGELDEAELRRAHRLAGESAAALGDAKAARDHFVRWIVLDPAASLPTGVSPKLAAPFADARAEADTLGRFTVEIDIDRQDQRIEVTLTAHDPLELIGGMRLRLGDNSEVSVTGTKAVLPAPDATAVAVAVIVTDARGNKLARRSVAGNTRPDRGGGGDGGGEVRPAAPTTRSRRWPVIVRWPTWTGVAVLAGGAAGYFAMQVGKDEDDLAALNADSAMHTFDEAEALRDRGRKHALYANVGFGVAGAAALAAILTFTLEPRGSVEITPAPTAGGASVTASVRF